MHSYLQVSAHWLAYYPWVNFGSRDLWHKSSIESSGWKTAGQRSWHCSWILWIVWNKKERGEPAQWLQTNTAEVKEWNESEREEKRGEGWRREIRLLCILLAIHTCTFHLRSHQLSNWESNGDVRAARISTRPELGAPLRPNQNAIMFTARTGAHKRSFSPLTFTPKQTPSHSFYFSTQTPLNKCTHNHAHTHWKTLTCSHTWAHTFCPMQSHFGLFQTIHCSKLGRWCMKLPS